MYILTEPEAVAVVALFGLFCAGGGALLSAGLVAWKLHRREVKNHEAR